MKSIKHALLGLFGITGVALSMFGLFKVPFAESAAKEHWRQALTAIVIILMLVAGAIALFIYTFDANYFKAQIVQYVKVHKQRELVLEGDIKISFFPKLGLNSGRMSLSERNSSKEFASIENARFYIAWFPLIRKQLEVDRVTLDGVHANVIRHKDGSSNFDDLLLREGSLDSTKFDIDGVSLTHSSVNLQDESEGVKLSLRDVNLESGRLTDAMPSNLTANFRMEADTPHISTRAKLDSHVFFERKTGHYEFANFEGEMEGEAGSINNLALRFEGTLNGFPATGLLTLDKLVVAATGKLGNHAIEANFDLPKLRLDKNKLSGSKLSFNTSLTQAEESMRLALQIPALEFANNMLQSPDISVQFDLKQADRGLQTQFSTPLSVNFETQQLQLSAITSKLSLDHPVLSGPIAAKATGSIAIDFPEQEIHVNYVAKIDDSDIAGSLISKNFQNPEYTVDIGINALDVDRYLQADWTKRFNDDATPLDFASLKELKLRGSVIAGEIKLAGIRASKLSAEIVADQSSMHIDPINASIYGGQLSGRLSLSAQENPKVSLMQRLVNIQVNELLHDVSGDTKLAGRGNLAFELHAEGDNFAAWHRSLTGNVTLALARGSLAGINLASALAEGKSLLGLADSERSRGARFSEQTEFSELKAVFDIRDGSAYSSEFSLKSPLFISKGTGEITLASGNVDYRLDTTIASGLRRGSSGDLADLKAVSVPMRVTGPYANPSIMLNFGSASGGNSARLIKANLARSAGAAATTAVARPSAH